MVIYASKLRSYRQPNI